MGLLGDGAVAHGPGFEPLDDGLHALHLVQWDGGVRVFHLHQPPEGVGGVLIVHQGAVLLEQAIVPGASGLLEQVDGLGAVPMVLLSRAGLVGSRRVQSKVHLQPQGVEGPAVVSVHHGLDLLQADAANAGDGVGKVFVHHVFGDAHRLEELGGLVGLEGRHAHFGGDLHDTSQDGFVVIVHRRPEVLVQHSLVDEPADGLLGQIGVDRPGPVAQQGGKVMHVPGLAGLQDDGHRRALSGAHQMLLQGGHRQQRGDGRVVFVHPPVGQDDDIGPAAVSPVGGQLHLVQRPLQGHIFEVQQGHRLHAEAGPVHVFDLQHIHRGEDGVVDLEHPAVFSPLLQQIAVISHIHRGVGDDLLPDGVDGRVGHLGEALAEIVEQRPVPAVQHRQGNIRPHGGGGFRPCPGHGQDGVLDILPGVAERLLHLCQPFRRAGLHPVVGNGQVLQLEQPPVQPFAVGAAGGAALLELLVTDDAALDRVRQQHFPRLQPGFLQDMGRVDVKHPNLGGQDEPAVVGEVIPGGAQAVAVQHRTHLVAVGEQDGGGAVPGLHHGGVVLVQVPAGTGEIGVVHPGLRDAHHHRQGQLHAAHHQKFQGVVQHGGVRAPGVHHWEHLVQLPLPHRGGHGLLPGQHPVRVAPNGVDLPIVGDEPVGVGPLPGGIGVGGEPGMDQGDGGGIVLILQIQVELPQLAHQEHPLIHDGPAGQGGHIGVAAGLLKLPPGDIEAAVEFQPFCQSFRAADEALDDPGHFIPCLPPQHLGAYRHLPPADELHPLPLCDELEHLHGLIPAQVVLGEKEHPHPVVPFAPQLKAQLRRRFGEKAVGDLQQNTHAVAGLARGVLSRPVLQLFHDLQRVVHRLMGLSALDVHNGPNAAGVVLEPGVVHGGHGPRFLLSHSENLFSGAYEVNGTAAQ